MAKKIEQRKSNVGYVAGVLVFLFIMAYLLSGIVSFITGDGIVQGNVALIKVEGLISTQQGDRFEKFASSSDIVEYVEEASANPAIKAIILEINSPGGQPVATDEIAMAVKRANKTVVAWIREMGASGAYWIASASEHIVANRMSITGSIGVFGSYLDFSGMLDDWNISYERLVAGQYKDAGVPFRELEPAERVMLQSKLDMLHDEFKKEVKANRQLSDKQLAAISQGEFYLGTEAKALGLVDELGGKNEAVDYIEKKLEIDVELAVYEQETSFLGRLVGLFVDRGFFLGSNLDKQAIGTLS